jgi:hypothetical protein
MAGDLAVVVVKRPSASEREPLAGAMVQLVEVMRTLGEVMALALVVVAQHQHAGALWLSSGLH